MVNAPLLVLLLIITVICIKARAAGGGSVALGVFVGLTLASTDLGRPITEAITAASTGLITALGSLAGA
ncbi:MAG: hypothetical protein Q4G51_09235 [Dermatophilus congolensis]|nr:hypothetical protein [Dermatophilus congolensis]